MNALNEKRENIVNDPNTPIPVEYTFFLEDGERDNRKFNRYYFNFPQEWRTSNHGEAIVGIRNISMMNRRRRVEFELSVIKYSQKYYETFKEENPTLKTFDEIMYEMPRNYRSVVYCNIVSWLGENDDLIKIWRDVEDVLIARFAQYNRLIEEHLDVIKIPSTGKLEQQPLADEDKNNDKRVKFILQRGGPKERDVQMDGYYDYDKQTFVETIFSTIERYDQDLDNKPAFSICFPIRRLNKNKEQDDSLNMIYDAADIFNVGDKPFQNRPEDYMNIVYKDNGEINYKKTRGIWMEKIDFLNVWDRKSCKVYSSLAESSSKGYIGDSQVNYSPIKYYKINSTDNQFWIEFYSGRHNSIPIKLPANESFAIDLQFQAYNKLLYV